jgi:hypothetical protein
MEKLTIWGRAALYAVTLACLAGCNDESRSSSDPSTPPVSGVPSNSPPPASSTAGQSGNVAPQIAGSPGQEVVVGQSYSFTPKASDANGDKLTFSIESRPGWASFNTATGQLSGTPDAGDVGSYEEISVKVTDGKSTSQLAQFSINVVQQSTGNVSLAWQAPTENTDGTPLLNLSGYKIHYGTQSGAYSQTITVSNPSVTRYVVENLSAGTWYFAVSAVTSQGTESNLSGEASKTI